MPWILFSSALRHKNSSYKPNEGILNYTLPDDHFVGKDYSKLVCLHLHSTLCALQMMQKGLRQRRIRTSKKWSVLCIITFIRVYTFVSTLSTDFHFHYLLWALAMPHYKQDEALGHSFIGRNSNFHPHGNLQRRIG